MEMEDSGESKSEPERWHDHACVLDRFALDIPAFFSWIVDAFEIWDRETAVKRISEIDPLSERIVVDGKDYQIPDACYQRIIP